MTRPAKVTSRRLAPGSHLPRILGRMKRTCRQPRRPSAAEPAAAETVGRRAGSRGDPRPRRGARQPQPAAASRSQPQPSTYAHAPAPARTPSTFTFTLPIPSVPRRHRRLRLRSRSRPYPVDVYVYAPDPVRPSVASRRRLPRHASWLHAASTAEKAGKSWERGTIRGSQGVAAPLRRAPYVVATSISSGQTTAGRLYKGV
jgi:hypothetical protein